MLKSLKLVIIFFFGPKFLLYLFQGIYVENQFAGNRLLTAELLTDLINFSYLLYTFRPRKVWPEFFSFGLDDHHAAQRRQNRGSPNPIRKLAPIRTAIVNNKALKKVTLEIKLRRGSRGLYEVSQNLKNYVYEFDSFPNFETSIRLVEMPFNVKSSDKFGSFFSSQLFLLKVSILNNVIDFYFLS